MGTRKAEPKDIPQISALYEQFYAYHANLDPAFFRAAAENGGYPKKVIESETADLLVAAEEGVIVGFAHIAESKTPPYPPLVPRTYAEVVDLFVCPDYRRKGIGSALLDRCKQWADDRGLHHLELKVLAGNPDAIRLYERQGFRTAHQTMRAVAVFEAVRM